MRIVLQRFPKFYEIIPVYSIIVFFVYSWAIVNFLLRLQSWLLFIRPNDIINIFAYALAFSLVESFCILVFLLAVAACLPYKWIRSRFVARGSTLSTVVFLSSILVQTSLTLSQEVWDSNKIYFFPILLLVVLVISVFLGGRGRIGTAMEALAERCIVLSYLYVPMGFIGLIVVFIRNSF